jgi:hypothetical protein
MYNYKIQKVVDEKIDAEEIRNRINNIALEFDVKVYTLSYNEIAWEADGEMENHNALTLEFGDIAPIEDIRIICYLINKMFKGAPVFLATNEKSEQIKAGHTPFKNGKHKK